MKHFLKHISPKNIACLWVTAVVVNLGRYLPFRCIDLSLRQLKVKQKNFLCLAEGLNKQAKAQSVKIRNNFFYIVYFAINYAIINFVKRLCNNFISIR